MRLLRFGGRARVVIAPGAEQASDPVDLDYPAGADLAVSLYLAAAPARLTGYPFAGATSFLRPGEHMRDATVDGNQRWPDALATHLRAADIGVVNATIAPYAGGAVYRPGFGNERPPGLQRLDSRRRRIRRGGRLRCGAALRDPDRLDVLRAAYDSDGLHPSVAGYRAMAAAAQGGRRDRDPQLHARPGGAHAGRFETDPHRFFVQ